MPRIWRIFKKPKKCEGTYLAICEWKWFWIFTRSQREEMLHMGLELCLTRDLLVSSGGQVSCSSGHTPRLFHLEIQECHREGKVATLIRNI